MISFDWEEGIFRGIQKLIKLSKTTKTPFSASAVDLMDVETRCLTLAQLVSGRPLLMRTAEGIGGFRGLVLFLPARVDVASTHEDNLAHFLIRTILNAAMIHLGNDHRTDDAEMADRIRYLFAVREAVTYLENQFDGFSLAYSQALLRELSQRPESKHLSATSRDFEQLRCDMALRKEVRLTECLAHFQNKPEPKDLTPGFLLWGETLTTGDIQTAEISEQEMNTHPKTEDGSEVAAPPKDFVSMTCLEKVDDIPPLPLHTFEKTETLETYKGGLRQVDGEDELEEHLEALNELDLREVIRGGRETQGFYKADIDISGQIPDVHHVSPGEKGVPYPEYHFKTRSYRVDWVTVFPTQVIKRDEAAAKQIISHHRRQIRALKNRLIVHRSRFSHQNRQAEGQELDLDAIVIGFADKRAGLDPGEKYYVALRKAERETAITLLFDISLSSGSWAEGRRILDVTQEAVLILGEVAASLGDQFRILCFASNTRNHCRVFEVKAWQEPWHQAKGKVCGVEPQGYTRMGPALRHALAGFDEVSAKRRGLLIITDGKPTDYDRYEGTYGREDVRMALKEGKQKGVHTHALALDPKARQALPSMFGQSGWQVLRHISDLTEAAVKAYGHIYR